MKQIFRNYPCLRKFIDVAIPSLMIAIEYDGSWYHQNEEKDMIRQKEIEGQGWRFIRYKDYLPDRENLIKDILKSKRS